MTYTRMRSFSISLLPQRISLCCLKALKAHSVYVRIAFVYVRTSIQIDFYDFTHKMSSTEEPCNSFFLSHILLFFHENERPNYFIETFTTHAQKITIKIEAFHLSTTSLCDVVALGRPIKKNYTKIHSLRDLYLFYIVSSFLFHEIINLISIF